MCWMERRNWRFTASRAMPRTKCLSAFTELGPQFRPQAQRREALPEVVERHAEAHGAVQEQRLAQVAHGDRREVLGELDHHAGRAELQALEEAAGTRRIETGPLHQPWRHVQEQEPPRAVRGERPQRLLDAQDRQPLVGPPSRAAAKRAVGDSSQVPAGPRTRASWPTMPPSARARIGWKTTVIALRSSTSPRRMAVDQATPCFLNQASRRFQPSSAASLRYEGR